ncbi:MAG: DUF2213 domain-containing protein, partial [Methanocorpusculum sp.]|nr:DUF2213 domain-containing protein [Methanocorpusculum sp.]
AIASFEGKPVVDEHPDEDVTTENYSRYLKGVCRDVRRGEGDFSDCIVGDLVIYDEALINKIKNGKREISCGYDCLWVPTSEASYEQREIRGNHIAVVDKGRAGHKVAIRDKERKRPMSKNIIARMLAAFAKDSETSPDDLLAASQAVNQQDAAPAPAPEPAPAAVQEKPAFDAAEFDARLKRIEDAIAGLTAPKEEPQPAPAAEEPEGDALDSLEEELQAGGEEQEPREGAFPGTTDEDVVTEDPDVINKELGTQDEAEPEEELGPVPQQARDSALRAIRNLRPVVAGLPAAQRKRAADSLAMLIRGQLNADSGYTALQRAKSARAKDAAAVSDAEYGRMIRDRFNPHYKNKEE